VELDTKEDFLSCAQREKETLTNFYRRFLQLKAQAPEVSDDQVIMQAIKVLKVGPLHSHLVRERPKIVPKLYEQFAKFSKSEVKHFRKLEQQRKIAKPDEAPRPRYSDNQRNYPKHVHNIDSNGCGPPENWEKNFRGPSQERNPRIFDERSHQYNQRGETSNHGQGRGRGPYTVKPPYCMYHGSETNHQTSILHVPWQRNQPSHKRLPHLSRDQKEDGARFGTTFAPTRTLRSQPHHAMGSASPAIFPILPSIFSSPSLPK
jgi:hypothetical protein